MRRLLRPVRLPHDDRRGRVTTGATAVLSTAVLSACVALGLSGCGNWISVTEAGQMGLTVDDAGRPVVAVMTCDKATPVVEMSEGRKKSDPDNAENVQRGGWQARHKYVGVERLALETPGPVWRTTTSGPGRLEPGTLFIVDGGTLEDDNASLGGVTFRVPDLARLSPDTVQVNGKTTSWRAFGAHHCS
jgi:hypothetical protein